MKCETCEGTGAIDSKTYQDGKKEKKMCPDCAGRGYLVTPETRGLSK